MQTPFESSLRTPERRRDGTTPDGRKLLPDVVIHPTASSVIENEARGNGEDDPSAMGEMAA